MKKMNRFERAIACGGLSLLMAGGVGLPISASAANNGSCAKSTKFSENHQELRAMRQKMLADAKAQDAALEKMVAELNKAPESKKADLEAGILTKLVAQNHERVKDWEAIHARIAQFRQEHRQISKSAASGNSLNQGMLSQNGAPTQK